MKATATFMTLCLLHLSVFSSQAQTNAPAGNPFTYSTYKLQFPKPNYDSLHTDFNYYSIDKGLRGKKYRTTSLASQPWPSRARLDSLYKGLTQATKTLGQQLFAFSLDDCFSIQDLFELSTVFSNNRVAKWQYDPRTMKIYVYPWTVSDDAPPPHQDALEDIKIGQ
jgi:hypothetical protein